MVIWLPPSPFNCTRGLWMSPNQALYYFVVSLTHKGPFTLHIFFHKNFKSDSFGNCEIINWELSSQHFKNTGFVNDKQIWYSVNQFSIPLTQLWSQHPFVCDKDWELSNGRLYLFIIYKTYPMLIWWNSKNWKSKLAWENPG